MIEAVNSVISNAALIRGNAEQASTLQSLAAKEEVLAAVARLPLAPYISPYVSVDTRFDKAVLQLRDSETGDVVNQFPSEEALRARQAAENARLDAQLAGSTGGSAPVSSSSFRSLGISVPQGATFVQETASQTPAPPQGAGVAQAAIAALSLGASVGQPTSTVTVTA